MVTVGYNPSTGKVLYQPGTSKVCVGCCDAALPCEFCPSGTTPLEIDISFSGLSDLCGGCVGGELADILCGLSAKLATKFNFSLAALLNGTHTLVQVSSCRWEKELDLGTDRELDTWCNENIHPACTDCSGDPVFSFDAESSEFHLTIRVIKTGATTYRVEVVTDLTSTVAGQWLAESTGISQCFELDGTYEYQTSVTILGESGGNPMLSDGTITITE